MIKQYKTYKVGITSIEGFWESLARGDLAKKS